MDDEDDIGPLTIEATQPDAYDSDAGWTIFPAGAETFAEEYGYAALFVDAEGEIWGLRKSDRVWEQADHDPRPTKTVTLLKGGHA